MKLVLITDGMCREIVEKKSLDDASYAVCVICENKKGRCDDCVMYLFSLKKYTAQFVCEHCLCNPLEHASESTIIKYAKRFSMTTNSFLKSLELTNDIVMNNSSLKSNKKYKEMLDKKMLDKKTADDENEKRIKKMSKHEKKIEELNKIIHEQKLQIKEVEDFNDDIINKGDPDYVKKCLW